MPVQYKSRSAFQTLVLLLGIIFLSETVVMLVFGDYFRSISSVSGALLDAVGVAVLVTLLVWLTVLHPLSEAVFRFRHRSERILKFAPVGVIIYNSDGLILSSNPFGKRIFGVEDDPGAFKNLEVYIPGITFWGESRMVEAAGIRANGSNVDLLVNVTELSAKQEGALFVAFLQDISELAKARGTLEYNRKLLVQQKKMSELGEISAGLAHEMNTPLSAIQLIAEQALAQEKQGSSNPAGRIEAWTMVRSVGDQMAAVVSNLLAFSRQSRAGGAPLAPIEVSELISGALQIFRLRLRSTEVLVDLREFPDAPTVLCNRHEVVQILLNLLNNAFDAASAGSEKWIRIEVSHSGESEVELSVTDSGNGVPVEKREHLFDPFFSSKEEGKGTGLGLSISKDLAQRNGGDLRLDGNCRNARFVLTLPVVLSPEP